MANDLFTEEFRRQLLAFIRRRVRNADDAEDILQTLLIKLHNGIGDLRNEETVQGWAYQAARNAVIDYYRRAKPDFAVAEVPDFPVMPEEEAAKELLACMTHMLERLPETYRDALIWSDLEGTPQKEVADRLGISLSGAKSRVQRGREKLKELVQGCCHIVLDSYGNTLEHVCHNPHCKCCETGHL